MDIRPQFVLLADKTYQEQWEQLTEGQKQLIENQATLRVLDTKEKANRFFESRVWDNEIKPHKHIASQSLTESQDTIDDSLTKAMGYLWK